MKAIFWDVPLRHQEALPNRTFTTTHQDGQHSEHVKTPLVLRFKMEGASPVGRMGVFRL